MSGTLEGPERDVRHMGLGPGLLLFRVIDHRGETQVGPEESLEIIDRACRQMRSWGREVWLAVEWRPGMVYDSKERVPPHVWSLQAGGDVIVAQDENGVWGVWC